MNIFKKSQEKTEIVKKIEEDINFCLFEDPIQKSKKIELISKTGNFDAGKKTKPWYIILPNQKTKKLWDIFICFWVIFSLIICPINIGWSQICFAPVNNDILNNIATSSTIFFFFDVLLNCFTSYMDEKRVYIYSLDMIITRYCKSYLMIDILSSVPFEKIFEFTKDECYMPKLNYKKVMQLFFILRAFKLNKYFELIEKFLSKFILIIRFLKLFVVLIYLAHMIGNIYCGNSPSMYKKIFGSCNSFSQSSPSFKQCIEQTMTEKFSNVYFYSLYTGIVMMLGSDFESQESWERVLQIGTFMFSTIITATIYSNVCIMLTKLSSGISPVLQDKIDRMNQYMLFMKFDDNFRSQIEEYHINIWYKQRNIIYEDSFLQDMSEPLQKTLLLHQWKYTFFAKSKFIEQISSLYLTGMVIYLKPKIYMKSDIVFSEGETGTDLFFVSKTGRCKVSIGGQLVRYLTYGDYFGEIGIFLRSRRRTATIVSLTDADFLYLEGKRFEFLLRNYPEDYSIIRGSAIKVLMNSLKLYNSSLFSKLVPSNHLKDYLFRKNIYLEDEEEDKFYSECSRKNNLMESKNFNNKVDLLGEDLEELINKLKI